jgi:hypothetical protein
VEVGKGSNILRLDASVTDPDPDPTQRLKKKISYIFLLITYRLYFNIILNLKVDVNVPKESRKKT